MSPGINRPDASRRDGGGSAGFTLVEALAAFAIVAVLALVVQRGVVQSRLGLAAVEDRLAAERVARSLLAEPVRAGDVGNGGRTGTLDGYRYAIRLAALALPLPQPERGTEGACPPSVGPCDPPGDAADPARRVRWQTLRQDIEVVTRRGTVVTVETIRLGQIPSADAPAR
ncbi:prepilin-type N-terminal cleavage/methylation domain-containing protein [uncultured Methylobacterium sp.]|uniref:prepilin-type N-terminal cleavage/methylation domain-containing protein n=1 Tax=uncultured Methylobacterium sp. TaxID=157278 RepID=UPI0035C99A72